MNQQMEELDLLRDDLCRLEEKLGQDSLDNMDTVESDLESISVRLTGINRKTEPVQAMKTVLLARLARVRQSFLTMSHRAKRPLWVDCGAYPPFPLLLIRA